MLLCALMVAAAGAGLAGSGAAAENLRAGLIGLDTSHVPAFTKMFNGTNGPAELAGIRIVAGYPGGTDMPASRTRVAKFTAQVRGMGVEIVDSIPALLRKVDVVLLESVDGRIHVEEAIPVLRAGKPLFIDKPVGGSLVDAIIILDYARQRGVPCFSSSSLRFGPGLADLRASEKLGALVGATTWGPCSYEPGTPDLFFYGIHGVEPLFVLMGRGCESVTRIQTDDTDLVSGIWAGGRVGSYRGVRNQKTGFGAIGYGDKGVVQVKLGSRYQSLCVEIARFFRSGQPPVSAEETLEIFAFMEAADESKRRGGRPVAIADVMAEARAEAARRMPR